MVRMNNITKKLSVLVAMMMVVVSTSFAQKFGHINSQQLLLELAEVKSADAQLETYQKTLMDKGQTMVTSFEAEYKKYVQEASSKTLSPVQMQQREAELGEKQKNIQKYELEVQQKLTKKREELFSPILAKIQAAIDAIGKEGGYTMIFDTSSGVLLHAVESEDLMDKVKAKL